LRAGCGAGEADSTSPEVEALSSPTPSPDVPPTQIPVQRAGLPTAQAVIRPVRLRIPAMSLDAKVDAVGIDARTGDFAVPPSVDRVGWYRHGPGLEARAGSIVIAGHVDSAAQGRGAFFTLRTLARGDRLTLTDAAGHGYGFQVVGVEQFRKTRIPLERYFARDGAPRITLITCGGPFDESTRHYRDNIVVTATA
ncbi:class F sortase, partial [Catellatospora methionotrophica]|uniref:class F sortase n=1 Tax=Catellatospora methionotrophica TaxID=121620 RepID=UPI0033C5C9AA